MLSSRLKPVPPISSGGSQRKGSNKMDKNSPKKNLKKNSVAKSETISTPEPKATELKTREESAGTDDKGANKITDISDEFNPSFESEEDDDNLFGFGLFSDLSGTPDDTYPEMKKIIDKILASEGKITKTGSTYFYVASEKWARDPETEVSFSEKIAQLDYPSAMKKVWKRHFNDLLKAEGPEIQPYVVMLQSSMWNFTDKSDEYCRKCLQVKVHEDLFKYLKTDSLSPKKLNDPVNGEQRCDTVQAFIGMLHNIIRRVPEAREPFRESSGVEITQEFRQSSKKMIAIVALMIQSYLVTEEENEKLNSKPETFQTLVKILEASIQRVSYNNINFMEIEIIDVINRLAVNDRNKVRIVKSGALPYYVQLLNKKYGLDVQRAAASGLWTLAFKCKEEVKKEPGCIQGLRSLLSDDDDELRSHAEGALWILEDKDLTNKISENEKKDKKSKLKRKQELDEATQTKFEDDVGHVFLSYQRDSMDKVLMVRDRLKSAGLKVWIDVDDMSGSVLESMAYAVENASVVVLCLSHKYKESASCRTEAEYTFRLRKRIIPIRLQTGYYPDGWLGIMVGSSLVHDVSTSNKFNESVKNLIRELGSGGKDVVDDTGLIQPVKAPPNSHNPPIQPSHEFTTGGGVAKSNVQAWTKEDVNKWIDKNNLQKSKPMLSKLTGPLLLEYSSMRQEAPEAFYAYLLKKDLDLSEALAISHALKNIHNS